MVGHEMLALPYSSITTNFVGACVTHAHLPRRTEAPKPVMRSCKYPDWKMICVFILLSKRL